MDIVLTSVEARVLGALIEKEMSTPEYYPLTLNALISACNQKSNREPVMNLEEKSVVRAIEGLQQKHLVWQRNTAEGRVPKYAHGIGSRFEFSPPQVAVLCVLLLRGPQTPGEIRGRTARLHEFGDLSEVEETLQQLAEHEGGPFVVKLPRQAGCRESRYAHLLCGEVKGEQGECGQGLPPPQRATLEVRAENERIAELEQQVADLRAEVDELRRLFSEFTRQFE
ncbi:MAG: YceH family protein [bacterium]